MARIFKYAFFTSTVACFFVAVPSLIIFSLLGSGDLMISTILLLSAFWVFLVPWLSSTLVLALLLRLFDGGAKRRWFWGGVSLGVYYMVIFLCIVIQDLINGHFEYALLVWAIWPLAGFGAGYLAAFIVDKIMKPEFDV
jgi:hypothetical protein